MIAFSDLLANLQSPTQNLSPHLTQYECQQPLNLYQSPTSDSLVTQAAAGRRLWVLVDEISREEGNIGDGMEPTVVPVRLCEDDYPGLLRISDLAHLAMAELPYQPIALTSDEIQSRIDGVLAFAHDAMGQPNEYLWGGTVGPNFDCSGLVQTAFAAAGIWLPRDAYQQEAFTQSVPLDALKPGDLVFFGNDKKVTHVGIHLEGGQYIHSSGRDQGRNGIGIDSLGNERGEVGETYYRQLWGAGRVVECYQSDRGNF